MGETPRFGVRFRQPPASEESETGPGPEPQRHDRLELYQLALAFTSHVYVVIELAAELERYFLRDQLDRKSAIIPQLVAQGLATAEMPVRRALFVRARQSLTDCTTILDMLAERRSVKLDAIEPARAIGLELLDRLLEQTQSPPKVW